MRFGEESIVAKPRGFSALSIKDCNESGVTEVPGDHRQPSVPSVVMTASLKEVTMRNLKRGRSDSTLMDAALRRGNEDSGS